MLIWPLTAALPGAAKVSAGEGEPITLHFYLQLNLSQEGGDTLFFCPSSDHACLQIDQEGLPSLPDRVMLNAYQHAPSRSRL